MVQKKGFFLYFVTCLFFIFSQVAQSEQAHWNYSDGHGGPTEWDKLKDSKVCSMGHRQSPIDINESAAKKNDDLPFLKFSYLTVPLTILNTGYTIQVNYPKGSKVEIGKGVYDLLQFHFHTPSEHALNNKRTEMEVHFVHKKDDGMFAVVGILIKKGKKNEAFNTLFEHFPKKEGQEEKVGSEKINPLDVFPKDSDYYAYKGSFTTPPCSEVVDWYVLKETIEISHEQISKFKKLFGMNSRPLQPVAERMVEVKN